MQVWKRKVRQTQLVCRLWISLTFCRQTTLLYQVLSHLCSRIHELQCEMLSA